MLCNSCYNSCCTCCTPSDCRPVPTTTTTTTTTTLCPDPLPCDEVYNMDCVVYSGCDLLCPQLNTGDPLTSVFSNLFAMYEQCNGPLNPTTSTTTIFTPPTIVEICLAYSPESCGGACGLDCTTYYTSSTCANLINTNAAPAALGCAIFTDALGTIPAVDGFYSRPGGLCYILGSHYNNGVITGITNCPIVVPTTTLPSPPPILNPACYSTVYNIPMPGNSFLANGVTVTVSSTNATNLCGPTNTYNYRSCMPDWIITSIGLGGCWPIISTTCDVTLTFSQPVNNVKIVLINYSAFYMTSPYPHPSHPYPHLDYQEEFTFTVDSGIVPTLTPCDYCFATITGNKVKALIDLPNGINASNGDGIFEISNTVPFTSLKIDGALYGFNCTQQSGLATFVQLGDFTI